MQRHPKCGLWGQGVWTPPIPAYLLRLPGVLAFQADESWLCRWDWGPYKTLGHSHFTTALALDFHRTSSCEREKGAVLGMAG